MKIGYARVSTKDQKLDLQIDALKKEGCEKIFSDISSGAKQDRPNLLLMLNECRPGDIIVIYKLDRLGRSLIHLVNLAQELHEKGIYLKSISDNLDSTTPQGKLMFNLFASLAEFERDLIIERTKAGLNSARARGFCGGRSAGLTKKAQEVAIAAASLYQSKKLTGQQICERLGICRSTLYSYLKYLNIPTGV